MFSRENKLEKQIKQGQRDNRRAQRELERDRNQLQSNEAQIKADIKRLAAQGNKEACAVLARQLVKNRQQVARSYEMGARLRGIESQHTLAKSNLKVASAAKTSTHAMSQMNKQLDPAKTAEIMKNFSKQSMKMSVAEEAMDDALDNIFGDTADEEDAVVQQVLDELGIETAAKLAGAPTPASGSLAPGRETEDIEAQLARLRGV
ncbi:hypothetical protein Aperf_G00000046753 [Anoplocephala perfoliata]